MKLTQQGRLLDASGAAVSGNHLLSFRIRSHLGGTVVWEEGHQVNFTKGDYAAILGADIASNPLDDSLLSNPPLYLEVEVDNNGPVGLRQEIVSAPYSRLSGTATNISGGSVDATDVTVGGALVIDGTVTAGPTILANGAMSKHPSRLGRWG